MFLHTGFSPKHLMVLGPPDSPTWPALSAQLRTECVHSGARRECQVSDVTFCVADCSSGRDAEASTPRAAFSYESAIRLKL